MDGPALKILLAEDDAALRQRLASFLHGHGYVVVAVQDGYQALEFAVRERPDLLLLDVHMPAGDGFSVHERLQRHAELATTPVIYMTHDPSSQVEAVARDHGAVALFHKPFELVELLATIEEAVKEATERFRHPTPPSAA